MEFQSFDTWEEAVEAMEKARIAADGRVQPWQAETKPGDFFIQATDYGFPIFGEVRETDYDFYESEEGKHYRFCRCYSVACPDGELGDIHVSVISALITKELFEKFRKNNWNIEFSEE